VQFCAHVVYKFATGLLDLPHECWALGKAGLGPEIAPFFSEQAFPVDKKLFAAKGPHAYETLCFNFGSIRDFDASCFLCFR
jgi:hypothetical protein